MCVIYTKSASLIIEFDRKNFWINKDWFFAYEYESMDLMTITNISEGKFKSTTSCFRETRD